MGDPEAAFMVSGVNRGEQGLEIVIGNSDLALRKRLVRRCSPLQHQIISFLTGERRRPDGLLALLLLTRGSIGKQNHLLGAVDRLGLVRNHPDNPSGPSPREATHARQPRADPYHPLSNRVGRRSNAQLEQESPSSRDSFHMVSSPSAHFFKPRTSDSKSLVC